MQKLKVKGKNILSGEIKISGSKNATLPILAASILSEKKIELKRVPLVKDVVTMCHLLKYMGSNIKINSQKRTLNNKKLLYFFTQKRINLHIIELNDKYSLIFSSLFLFLIGASLGAIIRKGGVGFPLVLSVVIFLTFHYIGLFAKNAAEDSSIDPFIGSWISTLIIAPVSIILTRRASSDKGFFNFDFTYLISKTFINPFKKFKKNE